MKFADGDPTLQHSALKLSERLVCISRISLSYYFLPLNISRSCSFKLLLFENPSSIAYPPLHKYTPVHLKFLLYSCSIHSSFLYKIVITLLLIICYQIMSSKSLISIIAALVFFLGICISFHEVSLSSADNRWTNPGCTRNSKSFNFF